MASSSSGAYRSKRNQHWLRGMIFSVKTSLGGDQLMFRYPPVVRPVVSNETLIWAASPFRKTETTSKASYDTAEDPYLLPGVIVADLLIPRPILCNQDFYMTLDETTFIGYPIKLKGDEHSSEKIEKINGNEIEKGSKSVGKTGNENLLTNSGKSLPPDISGSITNAASSNTGNISNSSTVVNNPNNLGGNAANNSLEKRRDELEIFNITFILRTDARSDVEKELAIISKRLAMAMLHEENRCKYVSNQVQKVQMTREEWINAHNYYAAHSTDPAAVPPPDHNALASRILAVSRLCNEIRAIYNSIIENEGINIAINCWTTFAYSLRSALIEEYAFPFRPYHTLLLTIPDKDKKKELFPTEGSKSLQRLIELHHPTKSFQRIQMEMGIPLAQVYRLAGHFLAWKKARIIHKISNNNIYVIKPINKKEGKLRTLKPVFTTEFSKSLAEELKKYRTPTKLSDLVEGTSSNEQKQIVDEIIWLLREELIMQLHEYIYLNVFEKENEAVDPPQPNENENDETPKLDEISDEESTNVLRESTENELVSNNAIQTDAEPVLEASMDGFDNKTSSISSTETPEEDLLSVKKRDNQEFPNVAIRKGSISANSLSNPSNSPSSHHYLGSLTGFSPMFTIDEFSLGEPLTPIELGIIEKEDDGSGIYNTFKRIAPHFRGLRSMQEIMWRENVTRAELMDIVEKYSHLLTIYYHEGREDYIFY